MKLYTCKGNNGSPIVPLNEFGFIVSDEIMNGDYSHDWGEVEGSGVDAFNKCSDALDSSVWTKIPFCYLAFPTTSVDPYKTAQYVLDNSFANATPFNMTRPEEAGSAQTMATINNHQLMSGFSWELRGDGSIMISTPCASSMIFNTAGDETHVELRFFFIVLASESIVDGKFNFTTDQHYKSVSCSIYRIRQENTLEPELWKWDTLQFTFTSNIPESWLVLNGTSAYVADDDPYSDDTGDSEPGGNEDDQNNWEDGDSNPEPDLPSLQATDAGFIQLFMPTITQLKQLANYLWSNSFDIDTFKRLFADPMDCILGLSIVPIDVTGAAKTVNIGNINTGISLNQASNQYKKIACGSINIHEKLHSYLDYSPYRKVYLFLPYIGTRELDIDMLNGTALTVNYHVDILSGACTAYVKVDGNVIETYSGQCSMNIPITSRDWSNTIRGVISVAGAVTGGVLSGGMSAPVSAAMIAGAATSASNVAGNVMNSKPTYDKSGSLGSAAGVLGMQKPFLIMERPRLCKPSRQNSFMGYPGFITRQLSALSGFTQVQDIKLSGLTATETERNEILSLLRSGVIL